VFLFKPRQKEEPQYKGKRLSEWLLSAYHDDRSGPTVFGTDSMHDALAHMGTNALPFLIKWIQYEPLPWPKLLQSIWNKLPRIIRYGRLAQGVEQMRMAEAAREGLVLLGPEARTAIPQLIRIVTDPDHHSAMTLARSTSGLERLGTNSVPVLVSALFDPEQRNRYMIVEVLGLMLMLDRTNATEVVPVFLGCLEDTEASVVTSAARALGNAALEPASVVPGLTRMLQHSNAWARATAATSLGRIGAPASSAVPSLISILSDTELRVRREATNALLKVAPEMMRNTNAIHWQN